MIVVGILGILASIAIPAFNGYRRRANTSEAGQNLNVLYKSAVALYAMEVTHRELTSTAVRSCVASTTAFTPVPHDYKQKFVATGGFVQLNFTIADYVYYGYGISSIAATTDLTCLGNDVAPGVIYTFYAEGDLDGDDDNSHFELTVGTDSMNQLYHTTGFYIIDELE
jgi:type II secretory pathway pseudopilin PulG